MLSTSEVKQLNEELAKRINHEARSNPQSPYAGKRVGIANGEVVVVADTWKEVVARLEEVESDLWRTLCLEASVDYDTPVRI